MEPTLIYLASGAAISAGALLARIHRRKGEALPSRWRQYKRVPIASAEGGRIHRIGGALEYADDRPLIAPLSGRECTYFEVTVEEYGVSPNYGGWNTIYVDRGMKDFFLRDDTGRARVHQESPMVLLDIDETVTPRFFSKRPASVQRVLDRLGTKVTIGDPECVCVREGVLEAGEEITVVGLCTWEPDGEAHSYRQMGRRLVVGPTTRGDMFMSDRRMRR